MKKETRLSAAILTFSLLGIAAAHATVLTFEGTGKNISIPPNWGSDIAADGTGYDISNGATPNIDLTWSVETGTTGLQAWEFYTDGEWSGAQLNADQEGTSYYLTLTPDSGYGVLLDSFVFDDYAGWTGGSSFAWNLYKDIAGGTLIASGSATTTDGQDLLVNTSMTSNYSGAVVLEIHNTVIGGDTDSGADHAIDSISFTQELLSVPPEPTIPNIPFSGEVKVLSLNTWQAGNNISGGVDKIADVVTGSGADVVAFSETWSYHDFPASLLASLSSKGVTNFVGMHAGGDVSLISRFPILSTTVVFDQTASDSGSIIAYRLQLPSGHPLTVCVAHLHFQWYALYLPRGYNGGKPNWSMIDTSPADGVPDYVDDVPTILNYDLNSKRDEAYAAFIAFAAPLSAAGEDVILAGDFNDGSHLDWVDSTRDMFGHNGLIIPWNGSVNLTSNGWLDSYRAVHPNPATHPGITWPSEAFGKGSTSWTPASDERDRIDFIYYNQKNFVAREAAVVGSRAYYVLNQKEDIVSSDLFLMESQAWPSDHKGVMTTFEFADSDMDDIPDYWELRYGMNPTNSADALIDTDMDTINNLDEYRSRTDPTNQLEVLTVDIQDMNPTADRMGIQWQSDNELLYRLSESYDLINWHSLQDEITPTPPTNSFTYAMTNATGQRFIRIEVK